MNGPNDDLDESTDPHAIEAARAEWYGLLSTLFYRAPGSEVYAQLLAAPREVSDADTELMVAWHALLDTVSNLSPAQIQAEYDALFGGVGKPDIHLFGSHHLVGFLNERPLVELRDDLRAFGVARSDAVTETEDHIACLLDAMQHLIEVGKDAGEGEGEALDLPVDREEPVLQRQHVLFDRHIASWTDMLCEAVSRHPKAYFYARLSDLLRVFIAIERQAFEMMEIEGESPPKN